VPVEDQARVRVVRGQQPGERGPVRGQIGTIQITCRVGRRQPGGVQQVVGLAQAHAEGVGQAQHHLPARPRPSGLQKREVFVGRAITRFSR
jgi:hypothetical protein